MGRGAVPVISRPRWIPSAAMRKLKQSNIGNCKWITVWTTASLPIVLAESEIRAHVHQGLLAEATLRQSIRASASGRQLRLTLSNRFGTQPVTVERTCVAIPQKFNGTTAGSPNVRSGSSRSVTFSGSCRVDIPVGATMTSDVIDMHVYADMDVLITIYIGKAAVGPVVTGHLSGKCDGWVLRGDHVHTEAFTSSYPPIRSTFLLESVESCVRADTKVIACFGDSITDRGDSGLPYNEYRGWIDNLASSLRHRLTQLEFSVLNLGISGDQFYAGGLARFDHDVMLLNGLSHVFVHMGVNDLGMTSASPHSQEELYRHMIAGYRQVTSRCRDRGVIVIGSTIMPFTAPVGWPTPWPLQSPARERTRQRLNKWIRHESDFDYVVDYAEAVTDPARLDMIRKEYQQSDYLHPSWEGYQAMAQAIDLDIFA